ncbi:hypothetical protein, partial [Mesorhizobium sp. M1C.F.Ca.ET.204.01.1.1]|uniref:hypothetical protein n=1 Tax=Mesorhizobium sp. M1C.F.Ca.ET.204.01.1.1 TaxID=2563929 RepID=UPI001AEEF0DB
DFPRPFVALAMGAARSRTFESNFNPMMLKKGIWLHCCYSDRWPVRAVGKPMSIVQFAPDENRKPSTRSVQEFSLSS